MQSVVKMNNVPTVQSSKARNAMVISNSKSSISRLVEIFEQFNDGNVLYLDTATGCTCNMYEPKPGHSYSRNVVQFSLAIEDQATS